MQTPTQVKDLEPKENIKKMIKYVVTNPEKDTKLQEDDLVFVLARHNPGDPDLWDEFDQRNNDMFDSKQHKLIQNINNMMLKSTGRANRHKHRKIDDGPGHSGIGRGHKDAGQNMKQGGGEKTAALNQYSTMSNQMKNQNQMDDADGGNEMKTDIHYSIGSKKAQSEFDEQVKDLTKRIEQIVVKVEDLNKSLNQRNNKIVQNVSSIIHQCLHEANDVEDQLHGLKD